MPSRTADRVYWLDRYAERGVRFLQDLLARTADLSDRIGRDLPGHAA